MADPEQLQNPEIGHESIDPTMGLQTDQVDTDKVDSSAPEVSTSEHSDGLTESAIAEIRTKAENMAIAVAGEDASPEKIKEFADLIETSVKAEEAAKIREKISAANAKIDALTADVRERIEKGVSVSEILNTSGTTPDNPADLFKPRPETPSESSDIIDASTLGPESPVNEDGEWKRQHQTGSGLLT